MMRILLPLTLMLLAAGCGSAEYRDTNRAVDANPLCASRPDQPNEPVSKDCERLQSANWSSENTTRDTPLDFDGKTQDDGN